jgi:hypothetical protein
MYVTTTSMPRPTCTSSAPRSNGGPGPRGRELMRLHSSTGTSWNGGAPSEDLYVPSVLESQAVASIDRFARGNRNEVYCRHVEVFFFFSFHARDYRDTYLQMIRQLPTYRLGDKNPEDPPSATAHLLRGPRLLGHNRAGAKLQFLTMEDGRWRMGCS